MSKNTVIMFSIYVGCTTSVALCHTKINSPVSVRVQVKLKILNSDFEDRHFLCTCKIGATHSSHHGFHPILPFAFMKLNLVNINTKLIYSTSTVYNDDKKIQWQVLVDLVNRK